MTQQSGEIVMQADYPFNNDVQVHSLSSSGLTASVTSQVQDHSLKMILSQV